MFSLGSKVYQSSQNGARILINSQVTGALVNNSQVRHRRAVAFREYRQPFFKQKLLLAACEPVFRKPDIPTSQKCGHLKEKPARPDHPYDVLLAKDMQNEIEQSQLIAFLHQNQMSQMDRRLLSNELQHEDVLIRYYNRDIARLCMQNTRYEPLLELFSVGKPFTVLFAPDLTKIDKIIRIVKKYPQVIMMAALLEHRRLVTIKQLQQLQKSVIANGLDQERALLCHTLSIGGQKLRSTLEHHQSQLCNMLQRHAGKENH